MQNVMDYTLDVAFDLSSSNPLSLVGVLSGGQPTHSLTSTLYHLYSIYSTHPTHHHSIYHPPSINSTRFRVLKRRTGYVLRRRTGLRHSKGEYLCNYFAINVKSLPCTFLLSAQHH
jgi:hypothetical protein